jgi:hypothetical protein
MWTQFGSLAAGGQEPIDLRCCVCGTVQAKAMPLLLGRESVIEDPLEILGRSTDSSVRNGDSDVDLG